jgi:hypothetical protein
VKEGTVDWNYTNPSAGIEEHMSLCNSCADARTSPEVLQKIRAAQSGGQKVVSEWTYYNPIPHKNDEPTPS